MSPFIMILILGAVLAVIVAALVNLVWLIGFTVSLSVGRHFRYSVFGYSLLGLEVALVLALVYGCVFGRWNLCVKEIEYRNRDLPASFQGFRIAHISDLHLSTFNDSPEKLQIFVDAINAQHPDLVCFTGDLVTIGREEAAPYTRILKGINAKYGVVSVFGNHDLLIYNNEIPDEEERLRRVDDFARYEREELGWKLLRDTSFAICAPDGGKITFVGVDNKNCTGKGFRTINVGDLPKAMKGVNGFTVLLSHDPGHWDAEVLYGTGIPLTLSGHTHAAQFSILGWNPASWLFKRAYGRYDENGQTIYVNPGLGCTVPFRIGARPEITVITLKK